MAESPSASQSGALRAWCPHCHLPIDYGRDLAGHLMLCPHCAQRFRLAPVKSPDPPIRPVAERRRPRALSLLWLLVGFLTLASLCILPAAVAIMLRPPPVALATPEAIRPPPLTRNELAAIANVEDGTAILDAETIKTGDVGVFPGRVRIFQIQDEQSFLAVIGKQIVLLTGVPTRDLADGREWNATGEWFEIIGHTRYVAVDGGPSTVMTARWFDASRIKPDIAEAFKRRLAEEIGAGK